MADIFISYAREDREWVERLANALVAEGYTVWWDWDLLVGKRYRETIETELQTAKAAVVVWSQHSVRSDFVRDEAEDAQQRNMLLPLLKEIVRPPAGFRQLQTADLSNWHGAGDHTEFRRMMKGVSSLVGRPASGDRGVIPVDPAHPTTHFADETPVAAPPPTAPLPTPPESPAVIQAKAPEPVAVPAHTAVLPPAPAPIALPPPISAHLSNPIVRYVVIGAVALIALIFIAVQFFPSSTTPPGKPSQPAALSSGGTAAGPAKPHGGTAPAGGTTAPATPGEDSGDVGQAGPHSGGTTPARPSDNGTDSNGTPAAPPAPPAPPTGGDDSGDVGQGH